MTADAGGTGNFANEPSPSTAMAYLTSPATLNVTNGFTAFSTKYPPAKPLVIPYTTD